MPLLQLSAVTLRYSAAPLLDQASLQIDPNERVALVGRNGAGKTSLMRLMTGEETPNSGEIVRPAGVRIARLEQEVPAELSGTVRELLHDGAHRSEHEEDWELDTRVDDLAEAMKLDLDLAANSLSGGLKRRVLLARALLARPDLLLLDEPTNHLDLPSIEWLESHLRSAPFAVFFITHDRRFLQNLATRIVEVDRGRLTSWACGFEEFLARREAAWELEEKEWAAFDKKLAQEEAWLRQGVKARRCRNEGRVKALQRLRNERSARRERSGTAKLDLQELTLSGQKVVDVQNASFAYDNRELIRDFTFTLWRGDKVGIIGPNGTGKSTLLQLLLGHLPPTSGTITHGTNLQIAYLDQLRNQIDDNKTVIQNVSGDAEMVQWQGRSKHIHGYLQDFLFAPDRARMPARMLSGGERNRLLLARLFLQPANLLVLDEPTNDLDVETLELLEELLVDYNGTLLLVSHDRAFLDAVTTTLLALEGDGLVRDYPGGYSDYLKLRSTWAPPPLAAAPTPLPAPIPSPHEPKLAATAPRKQEKMLKRELRELEELPKTIETLDAEQHALAQKLAQPELYQQGAAAVQAVQEALAAVESKLAAAYSRWEELENKRAAAETAS